MASCWREATYGLSSGVVASWRRYGLCNGFGHGDLHCVCVGL